MIATRIYPNNGTQPLLVRGQVSGINPGRVVRIKINDTVVPFNAVAWFEDGATMDYPLGAVSIYWEAEDESQPSLDAEKPDLSTGKALPKAESRTTDEICSQGHLPLDRQRFA